MFLGNMQFFLVGVAAELYDLHPVQQGPGYGIQRVCRGYKEHFRQVKGYLQEIVPEGIVLLPVKGLQKCRRWVTPIVGGQLIYLIHNHQRVAAAGLNNTADDAARHGAYVGTPVSPDFRLIMDTAQGNSHQLAVGGLGYALGYAGFTGSGRPHQTQKPSFNIRAQLLYRQILADTILHFFQTVMFVVQYFSGFCYVDCLLGLFAPRNIQTGVKIAADNRRLRRSKGLLGQSAQFFVEAGTYLITHRQRFNFAAVVLYIVVLTQFCLDYLHLLPEIVLPLIVVHSLLSSLVQLFFNAEHFQLRIQKLAEKAEPAARIYLLQDSLLILHAEMHILSHIIGHIAGVGICQQV